MSEIRWIFFDIGGTLVDESAQEAHIVHTIQRCFSDFGISYSEDDIFSAMRLASENYQSPVKAAIRLLSENEAQSKLIASQARYLHNLEILYSDTLAVLLALSEKYKLGIIANQAAGAVARLEGHGLRQFFSVFALSGELGISKPDTELFSIALKDAGCAARNAAYVGDRLDNDIFPAKSLGFTTVRILQGLAAFQNAKSADYEPDFTIESLSQLLDIF